MQRNNYSKSTPISPVGIAKRTYRLRAVQPTLSGFFDDLDLGGWLDAGKDYLHGRLSSAANGSSSAHIEAQNRAGADLNTISNQYQSYKTAGTLTVDLINRAQRAARGVMDNFREFASEIGSTRALQGAQDIDFYGNNLIRSMEQDKAGLSGGLYNPTDPITYGGPFIASVQPYLPYILGAGVLLLFMKGRR